MFFTCGRSARGLAASDLVTGQAACPRAPSPCASYLGGYDSVDHAYAHGGSDSVVTALGHQPRRPNEATIPFVASSVRVLATVLG